MQSIISTHFSPEELSQFIKQAVTEVLTVHLPQTALQSPKEQRYLTRKETAKRLGVTLTTLWNRTRNGEIAAHRFGNRVLYKPEDVEAALTRVKTRINYDR